MDFILFIIIGCLAGFLAGKFMKGGGFGFIGNLVIGVIGGIVGGFLFGLLGITGTGALGSLITATVGAVALLWIIGLVKRS